MRSPHSTETGTGSRLSAGVAKEKREKERESKAAQKSERKRMDAHYVKVIKSDIHVSFAQLQIHSVPFKNVSKEDLITSLAMSYIGTLTHHPISPSKCTRSSSFLKLRIWILFAYDWQRW